MRRRWVAVLLLVTACGGNQVEPVQVTGPRGEVFIRRVVAEQLSDPWEVTYGPDNRILY